jgi:hypothetical protein
MKNAPLARGISFEPAYRLFTQPVRRAFCFPEGKTGIGIGEGETIGVG